MTLTAVMLDSREPPWVHALDFGDVPTSEEPYPILPAGDAWLATSDAAIIVERKTFSDLLGSIQDERLFDQAARMVKLSPWCYLVVQGRGRLSQDGKLLSITGLPQPWNVHRIEGALATVQQMGVVVVRIGAQPHNYRDALLWLASRKRGEVKITARREAVMQSAGERILCALPGISGVRAQALLTKYQTAAWGVTALSTGHAAEVAGIGPATCDATCQAYGLDDDQILAVNIKEVTSE